MIITKFRIEAGTSLDRGTFSFISHFIYQCRIFPFKRLKFEYLLFLPNIQNSKFLLWYSLIFNLLQQIFNRSLSWQHLKPNQPQDLNPLNSFNPLNHFIHLYHFKLLYTFQSERSLILEGLVDWLYYSCYILLELGSKGRRESDSVTRVLRSGVGEGGASGETLLRTQYFDRNESLHGSTCTGAPHICSSAHTQCSHIISDG